MTDTVDDSAISAAVRQWVETVVVGLNLCPFAARELHGERIRFAVTRAATETELLADLQAEIERLDQAPDIETTLLIHPRVLQDFADYNQFLETVDALLAATGAEGTYQVASFHPQYQFAGTSSEGVENYTNRSPYPMLHLLREASVEARIAAYPDPEQIPERNIALMQRLGATHLQKLWQACFD